MTVAGRRAASAHRQEASPGTAELHRYANAGRLAAAISHELLSALGVAQTDVGFLCDLIDGARPQRDLHEVSGNARSALARAVSRIAAVLSVARRREGEVMSIDVKEVLSAALFDLDARLVGFSVVRDLQPVACALAERGALLQVLVSVLLDAADASPARGRIGVTVWMEGGQVRIAVDDEGPAPIAPDVLAGSMPLWICRDIVRSFGGELAAGKGPLGGRRITLSLLTERVEP